MEDTVLDLADARSEGDTIALLSAALRLRLTTPGRLRLALDGRSRHRHRRLLGVLLGDAVGVESGLELDYLRLVERPHGLPPSRRQSRRPDLPYRRDVDYEDHGLLVELDGRLGHEGEGRFRDLRRDNRHLLAGELTLRYGWADVRHTPCLVAVQVHVVLTRLGYDRPFRRCGHCRRVPEENLRSWAA